MIRKLDIENPVEEYQPVYDYAAIETLDEFKEAVEEASVIWAIDINYPKTEQRGIMFGVSLLEAIKDGTMPAQDITCIYFGINFFTDQLEHLCAATMHAKGVCEYQGRMSLDDVPTSKTKLVQVYDFETKQLSDIPEAELAPGMIIANVEGVGRVWIDASKINPASEFRHGPFDAEHRGIISDIRERLKEVHPMTFQQWEDGFRKDTNPWKEIAVWDHTAKVFKQCAKEFQLAKEQRQELFKSVLIGCLTAPRESVLTVMPKLDKLTKEQAQRAIDLFFHWDKHIGGK